MDVGDGVGHVEAFVCRRRRHRQCDTTSAQPRPQLFLDPAAAAAASATWRQLRERGLAV